VDSIRSDGGRAKSFVGIQERRDCVVCALSNATGIGYVKAHDMLKQNGRRDRRGTRTYITTATIEQGARLNLWSFRRVDVNKREPTKSEAFSYRFYGRRVNTRPTVASFIRSLPRTGRFIMAAAAHAFCYIDGKIVDSNSTPVVRGRVLWCYEIIPTQTEPKHNLTQAQINELWEILQQTKRMMGVA